MSCFVARDLRGCRRALFAWVIVVLLGARAFAATSFQGSSKARDVEKAYWERFHAAERAKETNEQRILWKAREEAASSVAETAAASAHAQARILREQGGAPDVAKPVLKVERDIFFVLAAVALVGIVSLRTMLRHRREERQRSLDGGYLSDGTPVSEIDISHIFAPPPTNKLIPATLIIQPEPEPEMIKTGDPFAGFFEEAQKTVSELSDLLKDMNSLSEIVERKLALAEMRDTIIGLVQKASPWPLRPAWQVCGALKLLLDRLVEKPGEASPSVVRTLAAGLDTLRDVCAPGIRPNLIIEPPLRILAADDDKLCRMAVGVALEKAGLSAQFAENGKEAVEMARGTAYDMAFLDIQMPEMDGIAACEKIRETEKNSDIQVVFVTVQSDFLTRARTTALGTEFIAKPFLVLEITMKAVICAVRKRLALLPAKVAIAKLAPQPIRKSKPAAPEEEAHLKDSFYADAPRYLDGMANLLDDVMAMEGEERLAALSDLHLHLLMLSAAAKLNDLSAATRLGSAMESLVRKLLQDSKNITDSTLRTLSHGLKVLTRLCVPETQGRLVMPVRLLVIEDEPLARRAVVGALQLAFERPDAADDGATALKMIETRRYDAIFSDVEMPEMTGFEFCRQMRARGRMNTATPVVFITSHVDASSRVEAVEVGGTDFIGKPFLPIEITVKALTLVYENRLPAISEAPELTAA